MIALGRALIASGGLGLLLIVGSFAYLRLDSIKVIDRIPGKVILLVFTCLLALRLGIWIYKRFQVPRLRRTILTCLGSFTFIALSTVIVPAALAEVHLSATEFSMKFSDFNVAAALTACAFGALMFACLVLHFEVSKFEQEKNCTL